MKTFLAPLIWKESRERSVLLGLCLAWMLLGTASLVIYELNHGFRGPVASFHQLAAPFGLLAGVLAAMRTARGETTDRTRGFSDSLPIPPSLRAAVRVAGGWCVVAIPIAAAALVLSALLATGVIEQAPPRATPGEAVYVPMAERPSLAPGAAAGFALYLAGVEIAAASWFYLLATGIGTFVRNESRAGYAAAALAAVTLLLSSAREMLQKGTRIGEDGASSAAAWACAFLPQARTIVWGYAGEAGSWGDIDVGSGFGWTLPVSVLLMLAGAWWVVHRLAGLSATAGRIEEEGASPRSVWIPRLLPLPTRAVALTWLAVRHALPMAVPGIAFAAAFTAIQWAGRPQVTAPVVMPGGQVVMVSVGTGGGPLVGFGDELSQSIWFIAAIWCIVVGAGLFAGESDSRIGEFWRTRPIGPAGLFLMKFLVGLAVTLLVLDGPGVALSWGSPNWGRYDAMNWPHLAVMLPLHATLFAIAVACTCVTRHAAVGGVLTFVLLMMSTLFPALDPLETYNRSRFLDRGDATGPLLAATYPGLIMGLALISVAAVVVGILSLRRYRPIVSVS